MFSKPIVMRPLSVLLALSLLSACSLPTSEDPPAAPDLQTGMGSDCLSGALGDIKAFVAGDGVPEKIEGFFNCLEDTVVDFEKNTRGRYEDRFTARELANFVERFFLADGDSISDSLMTEIFRLKQLFVGGAIESISRDEMFKMIKVIGDLKKITISINPFMKVYTSKWKVGTLGDPQKEMQYFELANLQVQQSAKDLASLIERNGKSYNIDNAVNLVSEIEKLAGESWDWIDSLNKAMPLVRDLKKTLTGGSPNIIEPKEWIRFSLIGSRGFIQFLRFKYFIQDRQGLDEITATTIYIARSVDDLFSFLGDMVESKPGANLTRIELFKILESLTSFIPGLKVSDELLKEVMKIKVVFFGGGIDFFVKADFDKARAKLEAFRELTEKTSVYLSVYALTWKKENLSSSEAKKYFAQAEKVLVDAAKTLGTNMENRYDLNDLKKLAVEIDKLYPGSKPEEETLVAKADKYLLPLISLKNILLSDSGSVIGTKKNSAAQDWNDILSFAAQAYSRFAYYQYFLDKQDIFEWPGIYTLNTFVQDCLNIIDAAVDRKSGDIVKLWEIDALIKSLFTTGLMPKHFSVKSINQITRVILQRFLVDPADRIAGNIPQGLTKGSTKVLRSEFKRWFLTQEWMEEFYRKVNGAIGKPGPEIVKGLVETGPVTEENTEMILIYKSPQSLSLDKGNRLYMSKRTPLNYSRYSTHVVNLARTAVRWVHRGYAMDMNRIRNKQGITLEEANVLFNDVRGFFIELGFLDPKDADFANSRFRDANLFTPFSNGDDYLDLGEGTALAIMLYSGLTIDGTLQKELKKSCVYFTSPTGFAGDQTVDMTCLKQVYFKIMATQFANMPELVKYISNLEPGIFGDLFLNLLKATGYIPDSSGRVKVSLLTLFPQISQYVETVFQRGDLNFDSILDSSETVAAYPVFKNLITQFSGLKSEKQNRAVFAWMLKKGRPPESLGEKAEFILLWVPKGESGWNIKAERQQVVKVLGYIADAMAEKTTLDLEGADNPALLEKDEADE